MPLASISPPDTDRALESPQQKRSAPNKCVAVLRRTLIALTLFSLAGMAFAFWLRYIPAGRPDARNWFNVFYVLFTRNEPAGLAIVALFSGVSAFVLSRRGDAVKPALWKEPKHPRRICIAIALATFAIAAIGTEVICHGYALTADENLADFQAKIFLRGKTEAEVPASLRDAINVLTPTHVAYHPAKHTWHAPYLPVYAAMRAVFQKFSLQSLLNPLLAAVTILALYGTARNIWPGTGINALIPIALLASSSQFLVMSMTSYAMPAHLALNTIWLWLYSAPDRRTFYLAPVVGAFAVGLHEPVVHALFVLPFLVRLVLQRRWGRVAVFGLIYLAACTVWFLWQMHFQPPSARGAASILRLWNARMLIIQPMNLLLIIGWASLATPLLALLSSRRILRGPPILQDAAISCVLTFGFYYFFYLDQAHGWGYRYVYGVLSCLMLLAVAGFDWLSHAVGTRRAQVFLTAGVLFSLLVQLPLRCYQVESFVRPFAQASAVFHAFPRNIVAFDPRDAWYSADLTRNDPFLEQRPLIVSLLGLTPATVAPLDRLGSAQFITREQLSALGLSTIRPNDYWYDPFHLSRPPATPPPLMKK